MERLTDSGRQYYSCDFMEDGIYIFINRLRKYEDTGLTPPEVQELKERDTKKPLTDLKACPNCGRYIGDDIRPYCHSCGQRLELED